MNLVSAQFRYSNGWLLSWCLKSARRLGGETPSILSLVSSGFSTSFIHHLSFTMMASIIRNTQTINSWPSIIAKIANHHFTMKYHSLAPMPTLLRPPHSAGQRGPGPPHRHGRSGGCPGASMVLQVYIITDMIYTFKHRVYILWQYNIVLNETCVDIFVNVSVYTQSISVKTHAYLLIMIYLYW